jgi:cell division cycle 20-like protein 1 (cofactor of APC complex)
MYKMLLLERPENKLLSFGEHGSKNRNAQNIFQEKNEKFFNTKNIVKKESNEQRKISKAPFKVLDAPNLQDDFYLNLLEWSSQNILSVALDSSLYMWNGNNNKVVRFCDINPCSISSIAWNQAGSQISIGNSQGITEVWDMERNSKVSELTGHSARVSSLSWSGNLLASGSRDRSINVHDLRIGMRDVVSVYQGHTQEVCGLKWSFDGQSLASGGNDNKLMIWNTRSSIPVHKFGQHCAAVKGLAWSPHNHGVLASGGGSADRTIKFWNTLDGTMLDSIDTGSQVCNLVFSKTSK